MYRLSSIEDEVLQRVLSNEMAAGFIRTFGVLKAVEHIVIGDFERGILKYLLDTYSGNDALHDLGDVQLTEIGKKVEKMYDELLDALICDVRNEHINQVAEESTHEIQQRIIDHF